MKLVFASNYFNHHQRPLSEALSRMEGVEYHFLGFEAMKEERRKLGYDTGKDPSYVCAAYESREKLRQARRILKDADVVIAGSAPEWVIRQSLWRNKPVLRYSERPLKQGNSPLKFLPRCVLWRLRDLGLRRPCMLCASAYTAGDFRLFGMYKGRTYRWGYFPEAKRYGDPAELIGKKKKNTILWCGRFLDWKHPDDAIEVARRLKAEGRDFEMILIGTGEMEDYLKQAVAEGKLGQHVRLAGSMKPEQVRAHMETAGIYLFTSDRQEGWGAVLNEAMNSGCAVVACRAIGSVPFLMREGENGVSYRSGDVDGLYRHVTWLLDHPEHQSRLGLAAYRTVTEEWNAETAAQRLVGLIGRLRQKDNASPYTAGPCSPAEVLSED